jgi:hypothetical protein
MKHSIESVKNNELSLSIAVDFPCVTTENSTYNVHTVTAIVSLMMLHKNCVLANDLFLSLFLSIYLFDVTT